jgi:leucyl-tRNA synthetase
MELVNDLYAVDTKTHDSELQAVVLFCLENILLLLAPIIPHFCEELFQRLGKKGSVLECPWPEYRTDSLKTDEVLVVVQVNGKLRSKFTIEADKDEAVIREIALSDEKIKKYIENKPLKKVIIIRKKQTLVNIVV